MRWIMLMKQNIIGISNPNIWHRQLKYKDPIILHSQCHCTLWSRETENNTEIKMVMLSIFTKLQVIDSRFQCESDLNFGLQVYFTTPAISVVELSKHLTVWGHQQEQCWLQSKLHILQSVSGYRCRLTIWDQMTSLKNGRGDTTSLLWYIYRIEWFVNSVLPSNLVRTERS